MTHPPFLIGEAQLITPAHDTPQPGTVLVIDGHIAAINPSEAPSHAEWINAPGKMLAPAIIDFGVFAVDPAAFHFGGIARAALMPDGPPVLDNASLVDRAAKAGKPDLWLHPLGAATRGLDGRELAEMGLMQRAGARAIATGRERIADTGVMARALSYAAGLDLVMVVHAEDEAYRRGAVATDGEMAYRLGLPSAPASVEAIAMARDIALAADIGAALHFRQVTTANGFDLIRAAKQRGLPITCGITPAHLLLSDVAIGEWRSFCRLSPPLRSETDRQAAIAALADGTIDVLCSGHDPRGPEDKRLPFADAAPGMAGAQTLLAFGLGLVRDGSISMRRLFDLLAANPARLLGINAGTLNEGSEADLILIDADTPWQVDTRTLPGRAGNTPFDGLPVQGRATALWKGGRRVV